jgi:GH24 family phage-related lysozyme (muramidase)
MKRLAAAVVAACAVVAAPALSDAPPDSATVTPSGGQARGDTTVVVSKSGIGSVRIDWSASCPLRDGEKPIGHNWSVTAAIKHEDGDSEVAQSDTPSQVESASGQFDLVVKMKPKLDKETFTARLTLNCNGEEKQIKQQDFTLCRGATGASSDVKDYIKGIEKGECKEVQKEHGPGTKVVCDKVALKEYNDPKGHCTIGWGHKLHDGKCECPDPDKACDNKKENAKPPGGKHSFHEGITKDDAQGLLDDDVATAEDVFKSLPDQPLNKCQFDGLTDFFFNIGRSALYRDAKNKDYSPSRIKMHLKDGAYDKIPEDMLRYDKKDKALHERREGDAGAFGDPDCGGC